MAGVSGTSLEIGLAGFLSLGCSNLFAQTMKLWIFFLSQVARRGTSQELLALVMDHCEAMGHLAPGFEISQHLFQGKTEISGRRKCGNLDGLNLIFSASLQEISAARNALPACEGIFAKLKKPKPSVTGTSGFKSSEWDVGCSRVKLYLSSYTFVSGETIA
ncbi:hypothetical protein BTVI_98875 [Pitangus sulphuratus]|nr:hypothetical protein BTVI_98875 [Pitangus sulphuratus]